MLETLPQTDTVDSDDDVPLDNWRQAHDECVSLQSQLQTLQQQATQEQQRAAEAIAHFDAALKNSPFASQTAFLAALLDEETVTHLEKTTTNAGKSATASEGVKRAVCAGAG